MQRERDSWLALSF